VTQDLTLSSLLTSRVRSSARAVSFENVRTLTPEEEELANALIDAGVDCELVLHEGWVLKQSRWLGRWRRRWLVLTARQLRFYEQPCGGTATEVIQTHQLRGVRVLADTDEAPATPFSCMGGAEVVPQRSHFSIVQVRTDGGRLLLLGPAPERHGLERTLAANELATAVVNASCAARTMLPQYLVPGDTVFVFEARGLVSLRDRYSVGSEIGRGRHGTVFAGRCLQTGRAVAIKKMPLQGRATTPGKNPVREKVREEVDILREVRSPYVVELLNYIEEGIGTGCLVMELLPGTCPQRCPSLAARKRHPGRMEAEATTVAALCADVRHMATRVRVPHLRAGGDLYSQVVRRFCNADGQPRRKPSRLGYSERDVREIMRMVLSGLSAIHDIKVAHRDLKVCALLCHPRPPV
jgi:hypothetical protein